jgi:hypothetical protein
MPTDSTYSSSQIVVNWETSSSVSTANMPVMLSGGRSGMGRILGRVGAGESPESPSAVEIIQAMHTKTRLIKHE